MDWSDGNVRKQLSQAILDAFPTYESLEQMLSYQLSVELRAITSTRNCSDAIFEVIKWARSQGKLSELIKAARKENPNNPMLREFEEQVWQSRPANTQPSSLPNNTADVPIAQPIVSKANKNILQVPTEGLEEVISSERQDFISHPKQSSKSSSIEIPFQEIYTSQENIIEAHNQVQNKLIIIQAIHDLFQGDEDIYNDQCQVACNDIQDVVIVLQQIQNEFANIPVTQAALRYLLYSEWQTFIIESDSVKHSIRSFHPTVLLRVRQDIHSKLDLLIRSLREIDRLIGEFRIQIEQNGNSDQFDQPTRKQ